MTGSQCAVCHVHMEKARVHYGGVSCYSCRAFFRRTTQRDELAKCKFDGKCKVDHQERKSCPPCRYDRCLRTGMRPDLVLDEDDKKRRFKKYKMSKEESQTSVDDEGNDSGSMHEGFFDDLKNSILEGVKRKKRSVSSDESNETKFQKTKVCEERLGEEDEESDTEDFFDFVKETMAANDVDKIYSDLAQNESFIDPETGLVAAYHFNVEADPSEDEQKLILQYIHKKFNHVRKGSQSLQSPTSTTKHTIENIIRSVNIKSQDNSSQLNPFNGQAPQSQRQSVIVRRKPDVNPVVPNTSIEIEFENFVNTQDNSEEDQQQPLKISLDLFELENLYRREENAFFQHSVAQFVGCWKAIPMGEAMMSTYVSFCQRRQNLPFEFMKLIQNQLRQRILNFLTSLDELNCLPVETQFSLLKKSLPEAVMMAKVWGFNNQSLEDEIGLVFADRDLRQLKETSNGAEAVKINTILRYAPLPDHLKKFLLCNMVSSAHNILGDRTVFMFICILLVFNDQHPQVVKIRDQYISLLSRYLRNQYGGDVSASYLLHPVFQCLKVLPDLALPFRQMEMAASSGKLQPGLI